MKNTTNVWIGYLNSCFVCLKLDGERLPDAELLHVDELALVAVDAPRRIAVHGVLGAQSRERADDVGAAVLNERARNDLEGARERTKRPLMDVRDRLGLVLEQLGDLHLAGAAARHQERLEHDVARHIHGVLEVALDLVEHVLARAAQYDRARLRVGALLDECVVLLADLAYVEEARASADVVLADLVRSTHDRRTACSLTKNKHSSYENYF